MDRAKLHSTVRAILGLVAAGAFPALHSAGYQGGAETNIGVDGGTIRDLSAVVLALGAVFYPQLTTIWKSLTNDPRVEALEIRVTKLDGGGESAEVASMDGE